MDIPTIYWIILAILLILSVFGLLVGVANDAVNFLNSAIGSRVAPLKVILLVASAGILLGAVFSSGMMEVARNGIFVPGQFHFHSVMMLFLAVMITEVILLDFYNTFGLPTSTTVSLVFALLGAAVSVAFFEKLTYPDSPSLASYMNSAKSLEMITGILSSVVIAFVCGSVVMYFSRLIFSFRFHKLFNVIGAFWCAASLSAITYFALFKGLQGTTILSKETMAYLNANMATVMSYVYIGWTVLMFILQHGFKVSILKFVILSGTFTLALAFAGNDLVNFIGVFMAADASMDIAKTFLTGGGDINALMMDGLSGKVTADWRYLIAAGVIMVVAIWMSKKARSVSDTEVNLASTDENTIERFGSIPPARTIVRTCVNVGKWFDSITPAGISRFMESRFDKIPQKDDEERAPFDYIRASVNLTVAALLISLATSMKLPLSTTYVTFMVAMGSSLADKAWGRESAVYRVTGVLTVISGWFMTALLAFIAAAIVGALLVYGGIYAIVALIGLSIFLLMKSMWIHKKREEDTVKKSTMVEEVCEAKILQKCSDDLLHAMEKISTIFTGTVDAIFAEDRKALQDLVDDATQFRATVKDRRKYEVVQTLQKLEEENIDTGHYYVRVLDYLNEVSKSLLDFTRDGYAYIDNTHAGFTEDQLNDLRYVHDQVSRIHRGFESVIKSNDYSNLTEILIARDRLFEMFAEVIKRQIKRACNKECGARNSMLYMDLLNEAKNIALQSRSLIKAQRYLMRK